MNNPRVFHFTLFEKQLVRSYLLSDKGQFLKEISLKYQINIITSENLKELIENALNRFDLNSVVTVTIFKFYQENFISNLLSSIFRYSNDSPVTKHFIHFQRQLGDNLFKTVIRYGIYLSISKLNLLKLMLRKLYCFSVNSRRIKNHLAPRIILQKHDLLYVSSLTPLRGQDIPIAAFFRKQKIKILASVRSWDNLLTNGAVLLMPDAFICHSEYMLNGAIANQKFRVDRVFMGVTPSYQSKFRNIEIQDQSQEINFSYMCQGTFVNPDENNFVRWLISLWEKMPSKNILYIVEHPAFPIFNLNMNLPGNVVLITFHYDQTTLIEYYTFLSQMNLVLGGGTTGLLDASFLGIPVVAIGFEIEKQNYWKSAKRYFDYFPWTTDFFNDSKIIVAVSKNSLIQILSNHDKIHPLNKTTVEKFTGNPQITLSKVIIDSVKRI